MALELIESGPLKVVAVAGTLLGAVGGGGLGAKKIYDAYMHGDPAPSFNCTLARHPVEVVICQKPTLAQLDRRIALLYARSLRALAGEERAQLVREQAFFLKTRNQCLADGRCISLKLKARAKALESVQAAGE